MLDTAHFIPAGADFLQFQANPIRLKTSVSLGVTIHHPKDQDRLKNRVVLGIEEMFPRAYRMARNQAIRHLTKQSAYSLVSDGSRGSAFFSPPARGTAHPQAPGPLTQ